LTRAVPYEEARPGLHDINQYLYLVSDRFVAVGPVARPPVVHFERDEVEDFERRMRGLFESKPTPWIAVAPGGGNNPKLVMPQKRWPAKSFEDLMRRLAQELHGTIFVVGDRSERNLLPAEIYSDSVLLLAGELTLRETALLLQKCQLFIGNDSGLMHIAGAMGVPSLLFFGPTSPNGKEPDWLAHRTLYTQESCSPCYKYGQAPPCPYGLKCLHNISVDIAFRSALDLMPMR
jgi:ADP-heptose:LPS heptosyltransferase